MTKNRGRLLTCAVLASGLCACATSGPPTVAAYTTRLEKAHEEIADLGRYTIPPPGDLEHPPIACACAVTPHPNGIKKPIPPPRRVNETDFEKGLVALRAVAAANALGKQADVQIATQP
jgi:hypothetical protein